MILLCGIPSESPLAAVASKLRQLREPFIVVNQRAFETTFIQYSIDSGGVTGVLRMDGRLRRLERLKGVYIRLMDSRCLPEVERAREGSPVRHQCRELHDTLVQWCEIAACRVVNRVGPMGSNSSKPYQAQLIREHGFRIPRTLITNDPDLVREFRRRHGRVIFKSISGVRSIVSPLEDASMAQLHRIRWCPVMFQEYVEGLNVRVHTVGSDVFATAISTTSATDYRYAFRQGGDMARLSPIEVSPEMAERCIQLSRALGLEFAGIDLVMTKNGDAYCLEVNPCPAFTYYEESTGQPIALSVARLLRQGP